jgi:hypothetical protein
MAKPKSGAKKATPAAKKDKAARLELLKHASERVAKAATKVVKAVKEKVKAAAKPAKSATSKAAPAKGKAPAKAEKAAPKEEKAAPKEEKAAKEEKAPAKAEKAPAKAEKSEKAPKEEKAETGKGKAAAPAGKGKGAQAPAPPAQEKPRPRATKLPPVGDSLTKREMEQLLSAGEGRGVFGEGSLKGKLVVTDGMPHLMVVGRDKRELDFLLQGPDQEVLPAYMDHKVSVSGLIRKTTNYGGTVDVRKYSAKKPEAEAPEVVPVETEAKLRFLSPGEVSMVTSAGMGAGIKGFASLRGNLEMTGEDFVLVVSNGGTRQQVSFILEGKGTKGMRKYVGQLLFVTGVVEKASGWGGRLIVENFEPRPPEARVSREVPTSVDVKLNNGLTVRLQEQPGYTWAIEPTAAKRVGLREARFEPGEGNAGTREFFFTPRNPGTSEVEFFLAKAFTPGVVERSFKITVTVKP